MNIEFSITTSGKQRNQRFAVWLPDGTELDLTSFMLQAGARLTVVSTDPATGQRRVQFRRPFSDVQLVHDAPVTAELLPRLEEAIAHTLARAHGLMPQQFRRTVKNLQGTQTAEEFQQSAEALARGVDGRDPEALRKARALGARI